LGRTAATEEKRIYIYFCKIALDKIVDTGTKVPVFLFVAKPLPGYTLP
jgi:hypothetical protein